MVLHTINAGPDSAALEDCLRFITGKDAIILTGDGVYCALVNSRACTALMQSGVEIYALDVDVQASGIATRLSTQVKLVGFDGFVALTEQFPRQLAWF